MILESNHFFQNVYLVEVKNEKKSEYGSFPLIFSYWMSFKVSECFTLETCITYLKRN